MNETTTHQLNDKRIINAWAFFDWANSSYALTIAVAIFPAYYTAVTLDEVAVFNRPISNTALYAFAISASYLILALFSPLLSGIADYGGKKMQFMRFFTILGGISCIGLAFFKGMDDTLPATAAFNEWQIAIGIICFILATMGFAGSLVFYNAYLPEIASEDQYDRVSAKGFVYGYIGSVILLILNLIIIQKPEWFGIKDASCPPRISFIMVGIWWIGFALIPFRRLPKAEKERPDGNLMKKGLEELSKVWKKIKVERNIKSFLAAFFCYSAGVQTILFLAATFAEKELDFGTAELIGVVLILQIVAILGAHLFARISGKKGNIFSLLSMLFIWIAICITAFFVTKSWQFYAVASGVGLVMGGIQSLSRSTYSKLLPEQTNDTTSFFSFYDILEKLAIVSGTLVFGVVDQLFGMRNSVLALAVFFIVGIIILQRVKMKEVSVG
ncbi:MAG: MFS transporter [Bacteroidota bacterium]